MGILGLAAGLNAMRVVINPTPAVLPGLVPVPGRELRRLVRLQRKALLWGVTILPEVLVLLQMLIIARGAFIMPGM